MTKKVSLENLNAAVKDLALCKRNHGKRIRSIEISHDHLSKRLERFDPHVVEAMLDKTESRVREVNRRLEELIEKITVCTELAWFVRNNHPEHSEAINSGLLKALDNPKMKWPRQRTLGSWMRKFVKEKTG
ncbi:MAG: hypothetical protein BMS9Abin02_2131 [Anaerolineae bacterium]|nr:MAG: hypothetical protein BMS9Abin02_2131 [Anaerolineae bacterium]